MNEGQHVFLEPWPDVEALCHETETLNDSKWTRAARSRCREFNCRKRSPSRAGHSAVEKRYRSRDHAIADLDAPEHNQGRFQARKAKLTDCQTRHFHTHRFSISNLPPVCGRRRWFSGLA